VRAVIQLAATDGESETERRAAKAIVKQIGAD
jgi:hypothetical protein